MCVTSLFLGGGGLGTAEGGGGGGGSAGRSDGCRCSSWWNFISRLMPNWLHGCGAGYCR